MSLIHGQKEMRTKKMEFYLTADNTEITFSTANNVRTPKSGLKPCTDFLFLLRHGRRDADGDDGIVRDRV